MVEKRIRGREQERISRQVKRKFRSRRNKIINRNSEIVTINILLSQNQAKSIERIARIEETTPQEHIYNVILQDLTKPILDAKSTSNMIAFPSYSPQHTEILTESQLSVVKKYPNQNIEKFPSDPSA